MPSVVKRWRRPGLFLLGGLLSLCGPTGHAGDSVTNTCRQHPAYCTLLNGQEAGATPIVRGGAEIASIDATLRFLSPELKLRNVVIHSGHPLQAVSIYDFKFPCPPDNNSSWRTYPEEHIDHGLNQGEVYVDALKAEAALVTPQQGVHQRLHP